MQFLVCAVMCSLLITAGGQEPELFNIRKLPCSGATHQDVSLYKGDIYTVLNNVTLCGDAWDPTAAIHGFRVHTRAYGGENSSTLPVVFVARQQEDGIVSWGIPFSPYGFEHKFSHVNRTVCPIKMSTPSAVPLFYVDVFSSSNTSLNYSISIEVVPYFQIQVDEDPEPILVGASAPQILYVQFPNDTDILTIQAETENRRCAYISIQNNTCPVNDLLSTARALGVYQTMSKTAFLTIRADQVQNREFLIIIITTNFSVCHREPIGSSIVLPNATSDQFEQTLNITVRRQNGDPLVFGFIFPPFIFILVGIVGVLLISVSLHPVVQKLSFSLPTCTKCKKKGAATTLIPTDSTNASKADYSTIIDEPDKIEDNQFPKLPDMCKKDETTAKKQYTIYAWNTVTVGIFYALPAFQLVLSQQENLNTSGNQDQCYYNLKCAYSALIFTAFNNIFSNIGYVILGISFLIIVGIRNYQYKKKRASGEIDGVPQYFGIYYAMGYALITEGFMSAFYHICPTNANFQFDTAFMFIIGGLLLVKVIQNRHPDIHANAFIAFFCFAVIILFTLFGIYFDNQNSKATRSVVFFVLLGLIGFFLLSFYHFHHLGWNTVRVMISNVKSYFTTLPKYKCRFSSLLILFAINFILVLVVVIFDAFNIATSVLIFFLLNLVYFLLVYTINKLAYREPITLLSVVFLLLTGALWIPALYFFKSNVTDWTLTPAESRVLNKECIVFGLYDNHDVWHFLSASAMFFSFLFMMALDDGVMDKKNEDLNIF